LTRTTMIAKQQTPLPSRHSTKAHTKTQRSTTFLKVD